MSNLFSSFDPASFAGLPLNWISVSLALLLIPSGFWLSKNQMQTIIQSMVNMIKSEFKASLATSSVPGILTLSLSLWLFITLNNSLGLLPYVFTGSSHLSFTLSLALPLWAGHLILAILKTPNAVLAHLVPLGTPNLLIPFMVAVEIISSVIRPLTLSVRLAANMTAGHLLIALLTGPSYSASSLLLFAILLALVLLLVLESAVSLIQAYVFSVLSTLYFNEVNSPSIS